MKTTKNLYLIIAFLAGIFVLNSCKNEPSEEMLKAQAELDSLKNESQIKDDAINEFLKSLNDIEANLATIKEKEKIITVTADSNNELKVDAKTRINDDIQLIYQLMQDNKKKINSLNKKMKNANIRISELEKMLDNLSKQIVQKDTELAELKTKLENMNIEIAELTTTVDELKDENYNLSATIDDKTNELNTAFYVFGTEKELKENKIITKEGGFIGLGKIEKLMKDFNKDYFAKVDIRKTKRIDLFSKKARIITTHPSSSYKFYGQNKIDSLVITNPSEFWAASKYLVIVVD